MQNSTAILRKERMAIHGGTACSILAVALPIGGVCPINVPVSEHQRVYGVTSSKDGQGGTNLRIEDCIRNVLVTLKDVPVLQQDLQAHLHTQCSTAGNISVLL